MNHIYFEPEFKLFTPGPTNIPNRVAQAAAMVNYHHRTASFSAVLKETLKKMQPLFGTTGPILPIHTTGRGALEGVYNNLFSENDKVLSVANGTFGEMAIETLEKCGILCVPCFDGWETEVDIEELERIILREKPTAITAVWNDTSNGTVNPIKEIGSLARKYNLLFVVDAVSALGCMPFEFDNWGVDAAVVASQKGLMCSTGISFAAVSERAMSACAAHRCRDYYINLSEILKTLNDRYETPVSTPVALVLSVNEALNMMHEEGLENVFRRHRALSAGTKAALEAMGFSLYPKKCTLRSDSLTVVNVPDGLEVSAFISRMRDEYGLLIARGIGKTAKTSLRIAHMGYCHVQDMLQCISCMEASLLELGCPVAMGRGTYAFLKAYRQEMELYSAPDCCE